MVTFPTIAITLQPTTLLFTDPKNCPVPYSHPEVYSALSLSDILDSSTVIILLQSSLNIYRKAPKVDHHLRAIDSSHFHTL